MAANDKIVLNAFIQYCVGHHSFGLWKHDLDRMEENNDIEFWADLGRTLERGKFDSIFFADIFGTYSTYQESRDPSIKNAVQIPTKDPTVVLPVIAQATDNLGLAATISATQTDPFRMARVMSTLDHLSDGRFAWNIVTSYLRDAGRNFGQDDMDHEERYGRGEEYMEVIYKLLEHSWEDDAVVRNVEEDMWADPAKVHEINHDGKYFSVQGPHLSEPSPQRTPVLYQAGQSDRGREFASKHAEAVFCAQPTISAAKEYVDDIRGRAEEFGRDPDRIVIINILAPVVGVTEKAAEEKADSLRAVHSVEGVKAGVGGWWDIDLDDYDMDDNIKHVDSMAIQGLINAFTKDEVGQEWTVREFLEHMSLGSFAPTVVGDPKQIADEMERWVNDAGIDGFNIMPIHKPGVYEDFVDLVVPELQRRGVYKEEYPEGETLRERLFGDSSRLPAEHVAHTYEI